MIQPNVRFYQSFMGCDTSHTMNVLELVSEDTRPAVLRRHHYLFLRFKEFVHSVPPTLFQVEPALPGTLLLTQPDVLNQVGGFYLIDAQKDEALVQNERSNDEGGTSKK